MNLYTFVLQKLKRPLTANEKNTLSSIQPFIKTMPEEVVTTLLTHAIESNRFTRGYLQKILAHWARLDVKTVEEAHNLIQSHGKRKSSLSSKSNLPDWYANTGGTRPSPETQARIDELENELLPYLEQESLEQVENRLQSLLKKDPRYINLERQELQIIETYVDAGLFQASLRYK